MPLEEGKSGGAFSHNVSAEAAAGTPQKQAVAIAYSKAGERDGAELETADAASEVIPLLVSAAEVNAQNRRFWAQSGSEDEKS